MHLLEVPGGLEVLYFKFQVSRTRKPIKKAPIHHLQFGSLEDWWFLTYLLEVPGSLEVLHFKFQVSRMSGSPSRRPYPPSLGWMLGGLVVPDALAGSSWWR